jgi:hypothetical protein
MINRQKRAPDLMNRAEVVVRVPGRRRAGGFRRQRGQSLIVAVIVMFVLLFVGAIFVALVARNLKNAGRSRDTAKATEFANGGLNYADYYIMNSPQGADWRPAPTPVSYLITPTGLADPDRQWLLDGYSRIELEGGRALIKVSMKPDPRQPLGKYLELRSVGRVGNIDTSDPTTFLNVPAPRLRRELIAYKAIGLTDYLRFVTNRSKDTKAVAEFGFSGMSVPVWMTLGGLPVRTFWPLPAFMPTPGAPIRVNSNLHLWHNITLALDRRAYEAALVAGDIEVEPEVANDVLRHAATISDIASLPGFQDPSTLPRILPSDDPGFSTHGGILRDAGPNPDINGFARSISQLEPPDINWVDPTGVGRYRSLTRNSGRFVNGYNTGAFGLGSGLYVDNFNNVEQESQNVQGGRSLRSVWLNPQAANSAWNGPYYIPPGAFIEFGYPVIQGRDPDTSDLRPGVFESRPGFRLVRDASDRRFRDPTGRTAPAELPFTFFIYKPVNQPPVLKLETEFFRSYLRDTLGMTEKDIDRFLPPFNGVIYAEGNIRVRGLLPAIQNVQIRREINNEANAPTDAQVFEMLSPAMTVVSGANIYIEGSIVREDAKSMLGLLADDYVVVNTTMFVGPNKGFSPISVPGNGNPPYGAEITTNEASATPPYTLDWLFGDNPAAYQTQSGTPVPVNILVNHRHTSPNLTDHVYVNFFVNDWVDRTVNLPLYGFNQILNFPYVYEYPEQGVITGIDQRSASYGQRVFQLLPKPANSTYLFTGDAGYAYPRGIYNSFRPAIDVNYTSSSGTQNYAIGRSAVVPMDVRIEAIMYAQNGSFFMIPGVSMNENPADTRDAAIRAALLEDPGAAAGTMKRPAYTPDYFPFYGEPIDCRITIVGAISENKTASAADQAAWMQMWGYIPRTYGSTGTYPSPPNAGNEREIPRPHLFVDEVGLTSQDQRTQAERNGNITRGIRFLYDPALVAPYQNYDPGQPGTERPFRDDLANYDQNNITGFQRRTLPPIPRLPVCPGFVFRGEIR